jgi:hypothetical protein
LSSSQAQATRQRRSETSKTSARTASGSRIALTDAPDPVKKEPAWLAFARRVPRKAYITALLLVAALGLFSWRFSLIGETATLKLRVQHSFKSAQITVFVDGESRYSGKLNGTAKRRFGARNSAQGSFTQTFHLRPGAHVVRVQIKSAADGYNESAELPVELAAHSQQELVVTGDRRTVTLRAPAQATESSATNATPTWYQSYFMSLSLTLTGTVVSMLFGYLVQQVINLFRKEKSAEV